MCKPVELPSLSCHDFRNRIGHDRTLPELWPAEQVAGRCGGKERRLWKVQDGALRDRRRLGSPLGEWWRPSGDDRAEIGHDGQHRQHQHAGRHPRGDEQPVGIDRRGFDRIDLQGIPAIIFFRDGVEKGRVVGAVPRPQLEAAIRQYLG